MTAPLAFVDCETTGLDPEHHEVWEVGLIRRGELGHAEDVRHWLLPVDIEKADRRALAIGRFADRHPQGQHYVDSDRATSLSAFAAAFSQLTRGHHLVGNVVSFDEERLRRLLRIHGYPTDWHYHLVDVEALVAGKLGIEPPWKSDELSRAIGVEPPGGDLLHTALGDAYWAMEMYDAVMAR